MHEITTKENFTIHQGVSKTRISPLYFYEQNNEKERKIPKNMKNVFLKNCPKKCTQKILNVVR